MDFYPGGFGADHGNAMGGLLNIIPKTGSFDRHQGEADISLLKAEGYMEGPVSKDLSYRASARRSYIDFFIEPFLPEDVGLIVFPYFTDLHFGLDYRFGKNHTMSIDSISAWDGAALSVKSKRANNESGEITFDYQKFFTGIFGKYKDFSKKEYKIQISPHYIYDTTRVEVATFSARADIHTSGIDLKIEKKLNAPHTIFYGGIFSLTKIYYDLAVPQMPDPTDFYANYRPIEIQFIKKTLSGIRMGLFAGDQFQVTPKWLLISGAHFSWFNIKGKIFTDPRLSTRYEITDKFRIKGSLGQYSQIIIDQNIDSNFGNPDLPPKRTYQYSAGIEYDFSADIEMEAEVYYKDIRFLPTPDLEKLYIPTGKDRSYGLELLIKHNLTKRFYGWLALTTSVSQKLDLSTDKWIYQPYDLPVDGTLVASYDITPKWRVSTKTIFRSGSRLTPRILDYYDVDHDRYMAKRDSSLTNSEQNPFLYQIDLRTDYSFVWDRWQLIVYLEIMNATMNTIPVRNTYNYDFSQEGKFENIPIIPFLGVRSRF